MESDRESAQEIAPAQDPDDMAVCNYRDAPYAARRQDLSNFSKVGLLAHRDNRR